MYKVKNPKKTTSLRMSDEVFQMASERAEQLFTTRSQYITNLILKDYTSSKESGKLCL